MRTLVFVCALLSSCNLKKNKQKKQAVCRILHTVAQGSGGLEGGPHTTVVVSCVVAGNRCPHPPMP